MGKRVGQYSRVNPGGDRWKIYENIIIASGSSRANIVFLAKFGRGVGTAGLAMNLGGSIEKIWEAEEKEWVQIAAREAVVMGGRAAGSYIVSSALTAGLVILAPETGGATLLLVGFVGGVAGDKAGLEITEWAIWRLDEELVSTAGNLDNFRVRGPWASGPQIRIEQ